MQSCTASAIRSHSPCAPCHGSLGGGDPFNQVATEFRAAGSRLVVLLIKNTPRRCLARHYLVVIKLRTKTTHAPAEILRLLKCKLVVIKFKARPLNLRRPGFWEHPPLFNSPPPTRAGSGRWGAAVRSRD